MGYLYFGLSNTTFGELEEYCKQKSLKAHAVEIFNGHQQKFLVNLAREIDSSHAITRDHWGPGIQ